MIITVDTSHDSPDDIRKAISMLQHLIGENNLLSNAPQQPSQEQAAAFTNLFQDISADQSASEPSSIILQAPSPQEAKKQGSDELFSDLFTEEDVPRKGEEKETEEGFSSSRKPKIEFY